MSRLSGMRNQLKEARALQEQQTATVESDSQEQTTSKKASGRVRHTIYLPPDISYKVKFEKLQTGDEISEIVTRACQLYFEKHDRNGMSEERKGE